MKKFILPRKWLAFLILIVIVAATITYSQIYAASSPKQSTSAQPSNKPSPAASAPAVPAPITTAAATSAHPNPVSSPSGRPFPKIVITAPDHNASISDSNVTISVDVTNFNGSSKYAGYIIYFMDVNAPHNPFQPSITEPGTYFSTTETSHTWTNVSPGRHSFSVLLVNPDLTPFIPVCEDKVIVNVGQSPRNK